MGISGRAFFKMTGSGNDFVFFDCLTLPASGAGNVDVIRAICARGTGVGADGIVFLEPSAFAAFRIRYFNSDGSPAALCGNATLCAARLGRELGYVSTGDFPIETDAGVVHARIRGGLPEIDLAPAEDVDAAPPIDLEAGERRIGFAKCGVPHLVIECGDVERVDLVGRGASLRHHTSLPEGANVNFLSRVAGKGEGEIDGWSMRTYERGVEAETLACGTGAAASAILFAIWTGQAIARKILTRSGRTVTVSLRKSSEGWIASLQGEGRLVYQGIFRDIAWASVRGIAAPWGAA